LKWYTDGAGWNGRISRYAIANEEKEFTIKVSHSQFTNNEMEYMAFLEGGCSDE
jgi:ribonuclease HI